MSDAKDNRQPATTADLSYLPRGWFAIESVHIEATSMTRAPVQVAMVINRGLPTETTLSGLDALPHLLMTLVNEARAGLAEREGTSFPRCQLCKHGPHQHLQAVRQFVDAIAKRLRILN
jgi:hypothetical protein